MLNAVVTTALAAAISAAPEPAPPASLAVGTVRDREGHALDGAHVRVFDATGRVVGEDRTDDRGTFAVGEHGTGSVIEVTCVHCAVTRVPATGEATHAIVVRRYAALESDAPASRDLEALPYPHIADDLGLIAYVMPEAGGNVSDRGLGTSVIDDNGMPIVNRVSGSSGVLDFPDRYVRDVSFTRAEDAYKYGGYGAGGTFDLDRLPDDASYASADTGYQAAFVAQPKIGEFYPGAGLSQDEHANVRRADLDYLTPFTGGVLRAGVTAESEDFDAGYADAFRRMQGARISYATASRRYRTFVDLSGTRIDYSYFSDAYTANYLTAAARIEKPGPVALTFGTLLTRATAAQFRGYTYAGSDTNEDVYTEAHAGDDRSSADLGLAVFDDGGRSQLLPSIQGKLGLGSSGPYVRADYSEAPVSTTATFPNPSRYPLDRQNVAQAALGYDAGSRVRAEAIVYDAYTHDVVGREGTGAGASLVWQIAPLISLRAWSLRVAPYDPGHYYYSSPYDDTSRQVLWATYDNDAGVRFDAIAHRNVFLRFGFLAIAPRTSIDGDVLVPVARQLSISAGSNYDTLGRHYTFGLRTRP